jgi:acetyl-CoA synthetase
MSGNDYAGEYYTPDEVAHAIRVDSTTVLRWIWDGKLEADRIGKSWRIRPAGLESFVQASSNRLVRPKK